MPMISNRSSSPDEPQLWLLRAAFFRSDTQHETDELPDLLIGQFVLERQHVVTGTVLDRIEDLRRLGAVPKATGIRQIGRLEIDVLQCAAISAMTVLAQSQIARLTRLSR